MQSPIYIISPINKFKTLVGWFDNVKREARFNITEKRYFQSAQAFGIDEAVFKRKWIQWCNVYQFDLWDGRQYRIKKEDFLKNCWLYPGKLDGVASALVFDHKLVLCIDKAEELNEKPKTKEEELQELHSQGVFG
jgi:hypothetical protein